MWRTIVSRPARGVPSTGRAPGAAGALGLLLLLAPPGASAQQPLAFEVRAGVGFPAFDLADVADPGPAVGLDLAYRVAPRLSVVAGGDLELLGDEGDDVLTVRGAEPPPDLDVWRYGAGLEAQLLDPARTYWRLSVGAGVGGSTFDPAEGGGSETEPSVYGGLELGWDASEEVDLFVGLRSWLAFAGDDSAVTGPEGGDTLWSFPLTGGVRLTF